MSVALILSLCSMILIVLYLMSVVRSLENRCGELEIELKYERSVSSRRQKADMIKRIEREKREKKYEYSVHPADVYGVFQHRSAAELNVKTLKTIGIRAHLIRREVGEWEEVRDEI